MKIPEFFEWPVVQNLAYRIVERLRGFSTVIENRTLNLISIRGDLSLADEEFITRKTALCTFDVGPNWISTIPNVICLEPWLIREPPEWHVSKDGTLCIELDLNWERELTGMVERYTFGLTADYATCWLLSSTRSLLKRHLFASRGSLKTWPKGWDHWAHGAKQAKRQLLKMVQHSAYA